MRGAQHIIVCHTLHVTPDWSEPAPYSSGVSPLPVSPQTSPSASPLSSQLTSAADQPKQLASCSSDPLLPEVKRRTRVVSNHSRLPASPETEVPFVFSVKVFLVMTGPRPEIHLSFSDVAPAGPERRSSKGRSPSRVRNHLPRRSSLCLLSTTVLLI